MKFTSLTSRLIVTVLCIEAALALFITTAAVYYQRREDVEAFDVMLQGRADSVLGSVQDAEDTGDHVLLDKTSIDVPAQDIYQVSEENGRFLGSSTSVPESLSSHLRTAGNPTGSLKDDGEAHRIRLGQIAYRAVVLHGVRLIDPDEPGTAANGKGTLHHIIIYYAAPLRPVQQATWHAVRFFLLADALALGLSVIAVAMLIRRSLRPLAALASQAALLSPEDWKFQAPPTAYQLKELTPLASALDIALQGLERAFRQQRTFVSDAAHELKTAVTVLKSSLQLLAYRERTREQYQGGIEDCLSDCGRMDELVQSMLLLARVEQTNDASLAKQSTRPVQPPLMNTVRMVLGQLESAAALRRIALRSELLDNRRTPLPEEDCAILLNNLVMNAIQHSRPHTSILVRLGAATAAQVKLSVIDQGEGIEQQHLPFVFERFYRTDASRSRDTGGTGLGLSICKAIVTSHGGTIQITSELSVGTEVTVILPAIPAAERPLYTLQSVSG